MPCDIKKNNEAVTCKLEVKPIVTMAKGDKTLRGGIKHLGPFDLKGWWGGGTEGN